MIKWLKQLFWRRLRWKDAKLVRFDKDLRHEDELLLMTSYGITRIGHYHTMLGVFEPLHQPKMIPNVIKYINLDKEKRDGK